METFQLTMQQAARDRRPFQYSSDGGRAWRGMNEREFCVLLEYAVYPDEVRERALRGETVSVDGKYFVRRTPTAAERFDAERQRGLFA